MIKKQDNIESSEKSLKSEKKEEVKELSIEEKLKETEDKLLRSLAEVENQRRRFERN